MSKRQFALLSSAAQCSHSWAGCSQPQYPNLHLYDRSITRGNEEVFINSNEGKHE